MSSYRHRLESESDSDASEEFPAPKHNNVRQYTPISDISDVDIPESSHSSDTLLGMEPDYGNLRIPLAKQNSNSQVGRLASKCNVPQLRKILAEYDVRGLSKMRKDVLVKSSIEAYDTLDPTRRHQLLESLSDPTGKERTVSSTIHGSPARNMRGTAKPVKKKRKTDDVWMKPRQPGSSRWQMPADDEDDDEVEEEGEVRDGPASRAGRRRLVIDERNRQADSDSSFKSPSDSDASESGSASGSPSEAETVRGKGITVSAQKRVTIPPRPSTLPVNKPGSFTISPPPNRPRIMLTLPKTPKPTDTPLPAALNDPSSPAQQRTNFPFNQVMRISTTSGSPAPPSPYVPRNNPQSSIIPTDYNSVPPPQTPTSEPVDNTRKRTGQGNLISFPSAASGGIPPPLKNLPSFALPSNNLSASPFRGHGGPPNSANGFGSPGHSGRREWTFDYRVNSRTSSTSSDTGASRNDQAPGVGQMAQYPPMYGGSGTIPHDYFATALAQDAAGPSGGAPQPTRYYTGSSNPQQQQRGDPRDPRTGFQSASRFFDPTVMPNSPRHSSHHQSGSQMPAQQAHQFPTQYHSATRSTLSQAAQNLTRIAPMPQSTQAASSSVMANNPFAAVFAGPKAEVDPDTQGRMEGDDKKQMVFKVIKHGPGVRTPAPPTPQYGRVIKPAVFHQILAEITPPISIRREPSMTSRGVYREIITTFGFDQSHKQMHSPDHLILMRFCQESLNRPAYEMHPDNLKLMLNGKTLVEPAVVDFSNRMKKKKNPVYNQPIEVPLQFLVGQNVVLARWTEDPNQPAAPGMPAVPDEPPKDYFLIVEYARRKTMDEILAAAMVNKVPVADTVHKLYLALGGGDNDDIRADSQKISLLCPASRGRLVVPIRGRNCDHVECFDASSFLYMNKMAKARWTCPKCNKSVQFDDIVVDEFTQRLLESFPNSENIEATFENDNIVVRESQKPQKGSGASADVGSTSEPSRSSASTPGVAAGSSSSSTTKTAPSASKALPEVITLD